jgi:hypothetical protein
VPRTGIKGHALRGEGAAYYRDAAGKLRRAATGTGGRGMAVCQCGEVSPELPSGVRRRAWHQDVHKPEVRRRIAKAYDTEPVAVTFGVTVTMTAAQRERYSAGLGVGFVTVDVLGRVRPEVLDALKAIPWIGQYASVSISPPEAALISEEKSDA